METRNLILLLLFLFPILLFGQQGVGINTDNSNPDASAILDVKSTNQGVLIPRMTLVQRNAIPLPVRGLLIFQTDGIQGFYYFDGTIWVQLGGNDGDWLFNGTDIYKGNAGNVGIGTTTPAVELTVDGGSGATLTGGGYILVNAENATNIVIDNNEIMARNNGATSPLDVQRLGGDFRVHSGAAGTEFVVLDNGNVGIGTTTPADELVVSGGRVEMTGTTDATGTAGSGVLEIGNNLRFDDNEIITNTNDILYINRDNNGDVEIDNGTFLVDAGSDRVEIRGSTAATGTAGSGILEIDNDLRFDGNSIITNTGATLYINETNGGDVEIDNGTVYVDAGNNQVGIGTTAPGNDLHVRGSSTGHVARIENTSTDASADGLVIELSGVSGANNSDNNNYITFERSGGVVVGRIEGFELDDTNPTTWGLCDWVEAGIAPDPWSVATAGATLACLDEGITYSSGNGDYAEWLEREDLNSSYTFGMVVGVRGGKINLNTENAEQLMVVSAAPIVLGNMPNGNEENYEKVAFMGQVPVAVLGKVNSGDYLVPSGKNDGTAIAIAPSDLKMEHLRNIIGRAWETKSAEFNFVNTIVGVKTHEIAEIFENKLKRLEQLEKDVQEIKAMLNQTATNK